MLAHLLAPLNVVLFRLGNDQVTAAELLGFVTGAASVWLTVRARISNFGVGIANSGFFLVLFSRWRGRERGCWPGAWRSCWRLPGA
jgi:nicotinamide mononucleotide transporter